MQLGQLIEFRKDLYFEGAVQADWFYSQEKASKVAENFVFHGNQYYGIENTNIGSKKRIDTVSLVKELLDKLNDDKSNALSLAIADYGTGKSHLAVTLGQIFSGSQYMPETYEKVLSNIETIDSEAANQIRVLSKGRNFVMVINGMRDFNLHSEILKAAQKSIKLYGLDVDVLKRVNRAVETAERFFVRNFSSNTSLFEEAASKNNCSLKGDALEKYIRETLLSDENTFEMVNYVYSEINGQEIRWDEGLSASAILELLMNEYCGMNGLFDHIILLFDEFGRYLEYASGTNAAKSGESALQQIYELTQKTQNVDGYLHVVNFIQSDIKTYLQRVDQTKNISRYIGRFDESEKYYISSNLETVFANLIQRKDKDEFNNLVVSWIKDNSDNWKALFNNLNRWLSMKGMWQDYKLFCKVAIEGIYPMHPISTFMLTNLSDYLQNRSSLTLISRYIDMYSDCDIESTPVHIMPEQLINGDLYTEMLSAEQEGRQKTQQCIKYDAVLTKFGDKLSEKSLKVLRANLVLRILRFKTTDYKDAKLALSVCTGLTIREIEEELIWLEKEYAVLEFDDHAGVFDFTEESNGAHDYKVIKKRLMSDAQLDISYVNSIKIQEIAGTLENQTTNFSTNHKISTTEWEFKQELYPIADFSINKANGYVEEWKNAVSSTMAKGRLVWLYSSMEDDAQTFETAQTLTQAFEGMPIVVMLIKDAENKLYDTLLEFSVLDGMSDDIRKKYERHFEEDLIRVEGNLREEFEELKKQRLRITPTGINSVERMSKFLTAVFDEIYPYVVPFAFDGFITKNNNIAPKSVGIFCSFLKILLSNSVSENTIHNFGVETRNRAEALFFESSANSWKCINSDYKIMPPRERQACAIYQEIESKINTAKELKCLDIYDIYSRPPYGLSEDIITLMIAVVCVNLSYCLRVKRNELKNLNIWKDEVITNNDKKVDLKAIKESTLVYVDSGAVVGKYTKIFEDIKNNKNIHNVYSLESKLKEMTTVDEVPEELEQAFLLALKTIESGKKAKKQWDELTCEIEDKLYDAQENYQIYNALVAMEKLVAFPLTNVFDDNGYAIDTDSKETLAKLKSSIVKFIDEIIDDHISSMTCTAVERIITFRNHQNKIQEKLENLGFTEYAKRVKIKKDSELSNVDQIKARQELRSNYTKFMTDSKFDKYTPYTTICNLIKESEKLVKYVKLYKSTLGKDGEIIDSSLSERVDDLKKAKDAIRQEMDAIWDSLFNIQSADDVEQMLGQLTQILQKGIPESEQEDYIELQSSLNEIMLDIERIKETTSSRKEFDVISAAIKEKYTDSEIEFDVLTIIESVVADISDQLNSKENEWKEKNLTLGDKSRESVHRWKSRIEFIPDYLSDATREEICVLDKEADEIIKVGKIDDVILYFDKLSTEEKKECFEKIKALLGV